MAHKVRQYKSNPPIDGTLVASTVGWALYKKGADSNADPEYVSFKLVSTAERAPLKANYHIGYFIPGKRLVSNHCRASMAAHRPELMEWLVRALLELGYPVCG